MPKSKRNKQISLTKTHKKPLELKKHLIEEIRSTVDRYANIFLFSVHNMRNTKLKEVREQWKHSRFFFGKNKVMAMALGRSEEEEYQTNLHKISEHLKGQCGLLFSNRPVDEVLKWFESYGEADFARSGNAAVCSVEIPEGPADVFHYSLEPYLRELGLPTTLKKGVVHLVKKYQVCKEGEILTPEKAKLLKLLGHQMAEFRIAIECYWSNNGSFTSLKTNANGCENQEMEVEDHEEENENDSTEEDVIVKPEVNGNEQVSVSLKKVDLEARESETKIEVVDDSEDDDEPEAMQVDQDAVPNSSNKDESEDVQVDQDAVPNGSNKDESEDVQVDQDAVPDDSNKDENEGVQVDQDAVPHGSNKDESEDVHVENLEINEGDVDSVSASAVNDNFAAVKGEEKTSSVDVSHEKKDNDSSDAHKTDVTDKDKIDVTNKDKIVVIDEEEVGVPVEEKHDVVDISDEKETDVVNVSDEEDVSSGVDSACEESADSNEDQDIDENKDNECAIEVQLGETKATGENADAATLAGNTICSTPQDALPVKKRVLINADGEPEVQNTSISEMQSHKRKGAQRGNKDVERTKVQAKKVESSPDEQSPVFRSLRNRTVKIKKKKKN